MNIRRAVENTTRSDLHVGIFEHGNRYGLVMFELLLWLTRISVKDYRVIFIAFAFYGLFDNSYPAYRPAVKFSLVRLPLHRV